MAARYKFEVIKYGAPDRNGDVSHDIVATHPDGRKTFHPYRAKPENTLARLRHNIAEQFWFDRMRARLARQHQ